MREQLQDEFLRLQRDLGKTILFVTHDIDEAVKLADLVAILRVGGQLAQVAGPARLLADPVDDFVADFVGRDRGYRALGFRDAPDLPVADEQTVTLGASAEAARAATDDRWLLVVDPGAAPSAGSSRPTSPAPSSPIPSIAAAPSPEQGRACGRCSTQPCLRPPAAACSSTATAYCAAR